MKTLKLHDKFLGLVIINISEISHCFFSSYNNEVQIGLSSGEVLSTNDYTLEQLHNIIEGQNETL